MRPDLDAAQSRLSLEVAGHIMGAFVRARKPKMEARLMANRF